MVLGYCRGFEYTTWLTYQNEMFRIQSHLVSAMSTETIRLNHALRNAFTNDEAVAAKAAVTRIEEMQDRYRKNVHLNT